MRREKLSNMWRGWLIGDFDRSVYRTKEFEVGVLTHEKGEVWPKHYHAEAIEINVLLEGKMRVNNEIIVSGDIFIFDQYEVADPKFLEDCKVLCVKTPSKPGDKYEVL